MIHSRRGPLRRVALSVALLAGVRERWVVLFAGACKYPGDDHDEEDDVHVELQYRYRKRHCVGHDHPDLPGLGRGRDEVQDQVVERDHGRGRVGLGCIRHSPGWHGKGHGHPGQRLSTDATPSTVEHRRDGGPSRTRHDQQPQQFPDLYADYREYTEKFAPPRSRPVRTGTDKISAGDDDANITIYNSSGREVTTTTADCTPSGRRRSSQQSM